MADELRAAYRGGGDTSPAALFDKGLFHEAHGSASLARDCWREVIAAEPAHYWALSGLGRLAQARGCPGEACAWFERALAAAGNTDEVAFAQCSLGMAQHRRGALDVAERLLLTGGIAHPGYLYFHTGLAAVYAEACRPPAARIVALCDRARAIDAAQAGVDDLRARFAALAGPVDAGDGAPLLARDAGWYALLEAVEPACLQLGAAEREALARALAVLPADAFTDAVELRAFAAAELLRTASAGDTGRAVLAGRIAGALIERAIDAPPRVHVLAIEAMLAQARLVDAVTHAFKALLTHSADPDVLEAALRAFEQRPWPAAARLLLGELYRRAPARFDAPMWERAVQVHDVANRENARKYGTIEALLEDSEVVHIHRQLRAPVPGVARRVDAWLQELFVLLGDAPVRTVIDPAWYRRATGIVFENPDLALLHYLESGWCEGLSPHPALDPAHVRGQLAQRGVRVGAEPELLLFLRHERALGLEACALLAYCGDRLGDASPWLAWLGGGWRNVPQASPHFDAARFLRLAGPGSDDEAPLVRFLRDAPTASCNARFDAEHYRTAYGRLLGTRAPIEHFLREGAWIGCVPSPLFRPSGPPGAGWIAQLRIAGGAA